eukprot:g16538.t2
MRRYRSDQRDPEENGRLSLEESQRKERLAEAAEQRPSSLCAGISVGFSAVVVATVAAKLHKYDMKGGGRFTHGAAAVVVEDVAVFLALFVLWRVARWAVKRLPWWERIRRRRLPRAAAVLLWTSVVSLTLLTLAYVAIEHLYFCSTSSLLDFDALVVAKRSLGPIIFIALQVEGERGTRMALMGSGALIASGLAAYRLRRLAASCAASRTGSVRHRRVPKGLASLCRSATVAVARLLPCRWTPTKRVCAPFAAVPKAPAAVFALSGLVFFWAALGPGLFASKADHSRVKLLRRNCFVEIAVGLRSSPSGSGGGMTQWAAAVSAALSPRIAGGVDINLAGAVARAQHAKLFDVMQAAKRQNDAAAAAVGGGADGGAAKKPNVVVVVLESTTGTLATASNSHGVSPWMKKLSDRLEFSAGHVSGQVMCGMTPSLETAWVEFDRPDVLEAVCLPGLLRSKLGYRSLLLTGSMVGGLGVFGHDDAIGFAGEEDQGGRAGFQARQVHDKFSFEHGTFEKVNYLGYDDHVVLNRSLSFLAEGVSDEHGGGTGGKLLTILTVGPHHYHDVPSDFVPQDFGPWEEPPDPESLHSKYLVALRYQDLFLERLYEQLDATGLADNTYVVIVGDHGEAFNEHGFDKHGNNVFEEGILVPFSLTGPPDDARILHGAAMERVGMHADIAPTILDLLGLWNNPKAPPARPAGRSRQDLLDGLKLKQQHLIENIRLVREGSATMPPRGVRGGGHSGASGGGDPGGGGHEGAPLGGAGSGLLGDSLLGPDYRGCAVGATHYGGKTLAVVAGDWKGLFMYRWEKRGDRTHAEVEEAQLFALSRDPRETENLLRDADRGSCCLAAMSAASDAGPGSSSRFREAGVAVSCHEAAQYPADLLEISGQEDDRGALVAKAEVLAMEVCCHLETAAVTFAEDNLEFFGRQGYEQKGEDKQPTVKQPAVRSCVRAVQQSRCQALERCRLQSQSLQGTHRAGLFLRGQPDNIDNAARRDLLGATSAPGHLALLDKCYMTDDCAPGLFMACCSGNCHTVHSRCDDIVPYAPSDQQHTANTETSSGHHDDGQYDDDQFDNDKFDDGQLDDGQFGGGQYDDHQHYYGQYDDGGAIDDGQFGDGQDDDGEIDDGQIDDDLRTDGRLDERQYDGGRHDDGQVDYGESDTSQHDDTQNVAGQLDDNQLDDSQRETGQNDDAGQFDNGQFDNSQFDDGQLDDGAIADDTTIATDTTDDDFEGPPMKIDPDGPYAHGRSYSEYDDDYYDGYSRGGIEEAKTERESTQPSSETKQGDDDSDEDSSPGAPPNSSLPAIGDDNPPAAEEEDDTVSRCVPDYSSGTMRTIASSSEERIEVVAMDSQGNTFYTLSFGHGTADTIRRLPPPSSAVPAADAAVGALDQGEDTLLYTGTGVILAMAVDADDNLVFSMEDAPAVSGGVYMLRMAPGGVLLRRDEGVERGSGDEASLDDAAAPAVLLEGGLGPFLPGIAVCPISGDLYVSRGHTGIARLVKDKNGGFGTKVEWNMEDIKFDDKGTTRAPLMIWNIAVNSQGIVYFTTYVQGVVLKAILPRGGGSPKVRLSAGSWDSGVAVSSGDGGKAILAAMAYPKGIAIDADDVIFVAEFQGGKIRKVSTSGIISTVIGTGSTEYEGDGGPASEAGLDLPNAIAFAPGTSGSSMAIADFGHSALRVVAPKSLCA